MRRRSQNLAWGELLQSHFDLAALVGRKFGGVAAAAMIGQSREAGGAIGPHPGAQTGNAAPSDIDDGLKWIVRAIETHRLIPGFGIAIATFIIGAPQLADLLVGEFELSLRHGPII
jgi:hypothetical protein